MPDYKPGNSLVLSNETRKIMNQRLQEYRHLMDEVPLKKPIDVSVYTGTSGNALLHLKAYIRSGNTTELDLAVQFVNISLDNIGVLKSKDKEEGNTGFQWSEYGTYAVAAVVYSHTKNFAESAELASHVLKAFEDMNSSHYGFLSGFAGLLYAGAFLNVNLPSPAIPADNLLALAQHIVDGGVVNGSKTLSYVSPVDGERWLGTTHGSAGVLYTLFTCAPSVLSNASAAELIFNTVDMTVAAQFPSGNFPTEYEPPTADVLVQWDHGAPGVSFMLLAAAERLRALKQDVFERLQLSNAVLGAEERTQLEELARAAVSL